MELWRTGSTTELLLSPGMLPSWRRKCPRLRQPWEITASVRTTSVLLNMLAAITSDRTGSFIFYNVNCKIKISVSAEIMTPSPHYNNLYRQRFPLKSFLLRPFTCVLSLLFTHKYSISHRTPDCVLQSNEWLRVLS